MFQIKFQKQTKNYRFEKEGGAVAMEGNLMQVTEFALEQGISSEQLTLAYEVMRKNEDTVAEFGVNGFFLYSHKKAA